MDGFTLYLLLKLDTVRGFLNFLFTMGFVGALIIWIKDIGSKDEIANEFKKEIYKKIGKIIAIAFIFLFIEKLLPTTKEAIAIYAVPTITKNEKIVILSDTVLDAAIEKLKPKK